jgi:glutathione synthase/RimK-type ligase-like ATP-grasp enzyme
MYRDSGGDLAQKELAHRLESAGATLVQDFDMRRCRCVDGRILTEDGRDLSALDVLFHMNFDEQTPFQRHILEALEFSGVRLINRFSPFRLASDKFLTNLVLRRAGVRVPPGMLVSTKCEVEVLRDAFERWGSVLAKRRWSAGGKGVARFDELDQLREFMFYVSRSEHEFYLEATLPFSDHDYRVEVIDGQCAGTYSRKLVHSYKTSVSFCRNRPVFLGLDPTPEVTEPAFRAAAAVGCDTTIIDLVRNDRDGQLYVIEVNCQTGMFIETAVRVDKQKTGEGFWQTAIEERKFSLLTELIMREAKAHAAAARA